jgi:hypothetical protein
MFQFGSQFLSNRFGGGTQNCCIVGFKLCFDGVDCLFALLLWGFERQAKKGQRNKMAEADAPVYSAEKATVHFIFLF